MLGVTLLPSFCMDIVSINGAGSHSTLYWLPGHYHQQIMWDLHGHARRIAKERDDKLSHAARELPKLLRKLGFAFTPDIFMTEFQHACRVTVTEKLSGDSRQVAGLHNTCCSFAGRHFPIARD